MVQFQDTNRVLAFVLEVVNRFLDRNNVFSAQPRPVVTSLGSPRKRVRHEGTRPSSKYTQRDHFAGNMPKMQEQASALHSLPEIASSHFGYAGPLVDEPTTFDDSGYFEWTDPASGESFLVDSNTGNSFPRNRLPSHIPKDASASVDPD
ncbi:hypothetical protein FS749_001761, partial [Ceratobasidium sp. UAMH 11750]